MVAVYVRQSIDKKDSLSIESQIEDCIQLCERNGWNDYKVYRDKGWSAKNLDRPSFQQMNEDVLNGKIEAVVCYKIDRISRSITCMFFGVNVSNPYIHISDSCIIGASSIRSP